MLTTDPFANNTLDATEVSHGNSVMLKSRAMENDSPIKIVGGLPEPIGGVTSFIYSMACHSKLPLAEIIDLYPSSKKAKVPIKHTVLHGNVVLRIAKLARILASPEQETVHFNFSRLRAVLLLLILPKRKIKTWYLMLHHGELEAEFRRFPYLIQWFIRLVLSRKINGIFAGSDKQQSFYQKVTSTKSVRTQPTLFRDQPREPSTSRRKGKLTTFLISGYPTEIYQHVEVLKMFSGLASTIGAYTLHVVLYGCSNEDLSNEIHQCAQENSSVVLHNAMPKDSFQRILDETDCYIRMNKVDSYGLVVAEAVVNGATVIASNVCERYPGTYLIDPSDFSKLHAAILAFSRGENLDSHLPRQGLVTETLSIDEAYSMLRHS